MGSSPVAVSRGLLFSCSALHSSGFSCCPVHSRVPGLSTAAPGLLEHKLSSCGPGFSCPMGMWDLPRPGVECVSLALAGDSLPLRHQEALAFFSTAAFIPSDSYDLYSFALLYLRCPVVWDISLSHCMARTPLINLSVLKVYPKLCRCSRVWTGFTNRQRLLSTDLQTPLTHVCHHQQGF